jgi:hypothetical protein
MAQADQTVQNATFPTVRADINNNLAALFTDSSGATAPTVTVAFQDWIDTSGANPLWKKRNAANNAWITLGTITGSAIAFEGTLPSQSGNSGEYLKTNGTVATWEPIVSGINAADVFASSGNWTCPAGVQKVLVSVIGGGGGGEGNRSSGSTRAGVSGGSGGYGVGILTVTPGTTYTVTVGAGGVGGAGGSDADGTAGGTSTFETISATGGAGGAFGGGVSGSCSSADATLRRSTVSLATPFLINGTDTINDWQGGTAAVAWAITSVLSPGALGEGGGIGDFTQTSAKSGGGGVGGAVLLLY